MESTFNVQSPLVAQVIRGEYVLWSGEESRPEESLRTCVVSISSQGIGIR